jgi:FkbM family methyltransferase
MINALKRCIPTQVRRAIKIRRAWMFERLGSFRYSAPALSALDKRVLPFVGRGPGVYLEIGANDGFTQSNTYYLDRALGWTGILIEPIPSLYRVCRQVRPSATSFNVACVADGGPTQVDIIDLDLMSVVLGLQPRSEEDERLHGRRRSRLQVEARTISSIIDEAAVAEIDLMSIDVEGAELEVLAGLDLQRHAPRYLVIETEHPATVTEVLDPVMVHVHQLTHHDHLYARADVVVPPGIEGHRA